MVASPEHPELFVEKKKKCLKRCGLMGAVAHGVSRSINFSQYFFCCFIVFLYMSTGCVSTFRSCVQGYLEWLPFVFCFLPSLHAS